MCEVLCKTHRGRRPHICFHRFIRRLSQSTSDKLAHIHIYKLLRSGESWTFLQLPNISRKHTFLTPESSDGLLKRNRWRRSNCAAPEPTGSIWTELSRSCLCQHVAPVMHSLLWSVRVQVSHGGPVDKVPNYWSWDGEAPAGTVVLKWSWTSIPCKINIGTLF